MDTYSGSEETVCCDGEAANKTYLHTFEKSSSDGCTHEPE